MFQLLTCSKQPRQNLLLSGKEIDQLKSLLEIPINKHIKPCLAIKMFIHRLRFYLIDQPSTIEL